MKSIYRYYVAVVVVLFFVYADSITRVTSAPSSLATDVNVTCDCIDVTCPPSLPCSRLPVVDECNCCGGMCLASLNDSCGGLWVVSCSDDLTCFSSIFHRPTQLDENGTCVDMTGSCDNYGQVYLNGQTWNIDSCTACVCHDGLTQCAQTSCPDLGECGWMDVPDGECCLVCLGCSSAEYGTFPNGVTWLEEDGCTVCTCEAGKASCRAELCYVSCDHPRKIVGQCCPVCEDTNEQQSVTCQPLNECSLFCERGYAIDEHSCPTCACIEDDLLLEDYSSTPVLLATARPFNCLLQCPSSEYKMSATGQLLCLCSNQPDHCTSVENCPYNCVRSHKLDKFGCPYCQCCPELLCGECINGYAIDSEGCSTCQCLPDDTVSPNVQTVLSTLTSVTTKLNIEESTSVLCNNTLSTINSPPVESYFMAMIILACVGGILLITVVLLSIVLCYWHKKFKRSRMTTLRNRAGPRDLYLAWQGLLQKGVIQSYHEETDTHMDQSSVMPLKHHPDDPLLSLTQCPDVQHNEMHFMTSTFKKNLVPDVCVTTGVY